MTKKTLSVAIHRPATKTRALWLVVVLTFLAGCATQRPADYMRAGFDARQIDRITVLPVVDHRIDQSKPLNLDSWVLPLTEQILKHKGYLYSVERDRSAVSDVSRDALESSPPDFIASVSPKGAKWVLLLALEDSTSKMTFGSTGNAEMSGYLFDTALGQTVWKNKEAAQVGHGGLVGMLVKGMMEQGAVETATALVLHTLPKRGG